MNYYEALEKKNEIGQPSGIWHMCVTNDGLTRAVGYCYDNNCKHKSEAEACDCYKQYKIDNHLKFSNLESLHRCEVCSKFSSGYASVLGGQTFKLCDDHKNPESVKKLMNFGTVYTETSS